MRFRTGLIVGKFSPLHRGHQHLIDHALLNCERVVVLSYANPSYPGCDRATRQHWLRTLYQHVTSLVVDDTWLAERAARGLENRYEQVPHDDEPEDVHRCFAAWLCHDVLGETCDAVFTSEDYGDGFAKVLAEEFGRAPVTHVCVDPGRRSVPISATAIRSDPTKRDAYLDPTVRASFVPRVLILGAESTGKTILAQTLARRLGEPMVEEYGRQLWIDRGGELSFEDLLRIGEVQVEWEERAALGARHYLICDTSPLTTLFYSLAMFGRADPKLERLAERLYDRVFLCLPEFPFVQDGTRQDERFRERQHDWYVEELRTRGISYAALSGNDNTRADKVEAVLAS